MSPALLDTDVLSLYLRQGGIAIVDHCRRYIQRYGRLTLGILTYYEVVSGLRYRDARKQLDAFHRFVARNIDLLIAGIALVHGLVLVTRNRRHFGRIEGLTLADRSEPETFGDAP